MIFATADMTSTFSPSDSSGSVAVISMESPKTMALSLKPSRWMMLLSAVSKSSDGHCPSASHDRHATRWASLSFSGGISIVSPIFKPSGGTANGNGWHASSHMRKNFSPVAVAAPCPSRRNNSAKYCSIFSISPALLNMISLCACHGCFDKIYSFSASNPQQSSISTAKPA